MKGDHVHAYITTRLRENEVPKNPCYKAGDKVFICTECGLLRFGNPWVDRDRRTRDPGDTY